jgi:hypothetical protein
MAGIKPGFVTGANAKIQIGTKTLAYATNVSYDVNVITVPIEGIGRYEVWSNEPVAFQVNGSLSIVRYTKRGADAEIPLASPNGNSLDQIPTGETTTLAGHLSPGDILTSETFDMTLYDKAASGNESDAVSILALTDCRITRRTGNLDKRGVLSDQYTFVGVLAGDKIESGIAATPSGDPDLGTT